MKIEISRIEGKLVAAIPADDGSYMLTVRIGKIDYEIHSDEIRNFKEVREKGILSYQNEVVIIEDGNMEIPLNT
jgi:hypothetical protein